jgi:hypothetical protein
MPSIGSDQRLTPASSVAPIILIFQRFQQALLAHP